MNKIVSQLALLAMLIFSARSGFPASPKSNSPKPAAAAPSKPASLPASKPASLPLAQSDAASSPSVKPVSSPAAKPASLPVAQSDAASSPSAKLASSPSKPPSSPAAKPASSLAAKSDAASSKTASAPLIKLPPNWIWGEPTKLETPDGIVLKGVIKPPRSPRTTTILFICDDRTSFVEGFRPLIARFAAKGYGIAVFDTRGTGFSNLKSDGAKFNIRDYERDLKQYEMMIEDVKQIVDYLRQKRKVGPFRIVTIGASVGANVAIMASAELPGDVRSTVAISPGVNYRYLEPMSAVKSFGGRPLLALSASADEFSYGCLQKMRQVAPEVETFSFAGSGHGFKLLNPEAIEKIIKWVDSH